MQLLAISDEINVLIKDQSHCDILLMLLIRKHHGPHGVLRLLSEQNKKWWGNFECFKSIREQLKVCTIIYTVHMYTIDLYDLS